MRKLLRTFWAF